MAKHHIVIGSFLMIFSLGLFFYAIRSGEAFAPGWIKNCKRADDPVGYWAWVALYLVFFCMGALAFAGIN